MQVRKGSKPVEIKVRLPEEIRPGAYANLMQATHTREEFCLDFISVFRGQGVVTARVICSPGHLKRIVAALRENLSKYEDRHGTIELAREADGGTIGFTSE